LHGIAAPDKKALDELQGNRRQAAGLRAQLNAAALRLSVQAHQAGQVHLRLDDRPAGAVDLVGGERQTWPLRQQATLEIPGWGTVELARGHQDQDLERSARELAGLDREFRDAVLSYQEDPQDEGCLDRLAERRFERENGVRRLEELQQELLRLA